MLRPLGKLGLTICLTVCLAMLGGEASPGEPIPEPGSPRIGLPPPAKLKPGKFRRDSSGQIILEPPKAAAKEVPSRKSAQPSPVTDKAKLPTSSALRPDAVKNGSTEASTKREPQPAPKRAQLPEPATLQRGEFQRDAAGQLVLTAREPKDLRICHPKTAIEGCEYLTLAAAIADARPGDTIILSPGVYEQAALVNVPGITIKGEPGAHLKGRAVEGKAALVIRANDVVIDGIECSHISVRDRNGACIRMEGDNLTVRNVYFHDNQQGILSGPGKGILVVENSVFERNGFNTGRAHGLYVSKNVETFIFRKNKILATKNEGQGLKSRAQRTIIENNVIASLDGRDSRAIDIPNGGDVIIRGNILQKGPNSANSQMIGLALEGRFNSVNKTIIENNIIIFDLDRPKWIDFISDVFDIAPPRGKVIYSKSPGEVVLRNNTIVGARTIGDGVIQEENRLFRTRRSAGLPDYPELPKATP